MTYCNDCTARATCPFYEKDAEECVYEALAEFCENSKKILDKSQIM